MRSLRCGFAPRILVAATARACVIGALVVVGGCASQQAQHQPPVRVAGPVGPDQQMPGIKVEIEDDGLPSQLAPRNRKPVRDDPTEPWSPNYGTVPVRRADDAPVMQPRLAPQPVRLSSLDEDEIIRRAITEHEMRRRD